MSKKSKDNGIVLGTIGVILCIFGIFGSIPTLTSKLNSSILIGTGLAVIIGIILIAISMNN